MGYYGEGYYGEGYYGEGWGEEEVAIEESVGIALVEPADTPIKDVKYNLVDKLVNNLPNYFDKDSYPIAVFTITGVLQVTIDVDERLLYIKQDINVFSYDLASKTVGEIKTMLEAAGYCLELHNLDYDNLYWFTLISQSSTGLIFAEESVLKRFYGAVAQAIIDSYQDLTDGLSELYFKYAKETWLDLWGGYFGYGRISSETDTEYFTRTIQEIISIKCNNKALMKLLKDSVSYFVDIRDFGWYDQTDWALTNSIMTLTNTEGDFAKTYNDDTGTPVITNTFGVYLYAGSINNLNSRDKQAITSIIDKYRAAGNHPKYFAPADFYVSNEVGLTNEVGNVTAPNPQNWTEVII